MTEYKTGSNETRVLDVRKHKAFTPKTCVGCGKQITKGVFYTKAIGIGDGKFISTSWHTECQENHAGYVKDRQSEE